MNRFGLDLLVSLTGQDIDECSQSIGHLCTYKCVNVPGSYQCACPEHGYTMSPNGRSCRGDNRKEIARKEQIQYLLRRIEKKKLAHFLRFLVSQYLGFLNWIVCPEK